MTIKEKIVKPPKGRVSRQSLTRKNKFRIEDQDPNYHYRMVNDIDDRIEDLIGLGYELVDKKVSTGDTEVDKASSMGATTARHVGNGIKAYLMRIPKEEYELAQAEKNAHLDQVEAQLKGQTALDGNYGKITVTREQVRN